MRCALPCSFSEAYFISVHLQHACYVLPHQEFSSNGRLWRDIEVRERPLLESTTGRNGSILFARTSP